MNGVHQRRKRESAAGPNLVAQSPFYRNLATGSRDPGLCCRRLDREPAAKFASGPGAIVSFGVALSTAERWNLETCRREARS